MNTVPIENRCPKCAAPLPDDAPAGLCPKCLLLAAATPTETGAGAAAPAHAPSLEAVQAAFPQLEILELIGVGGMGAVFKARQPKLDRLVALKILAPALAASPAFAERFNREARVLARLSHPGIVNVFDFGMVGPAASPPAADAVAGGTPTGPAGKMPALQTGGTPTGPAGKMPALQTGGTPAPLYFLLMEYVDGVNLRQAMQAGRFTPAQALALVPKICEALQFAHDEGILHRDIKPENILLDTKGRVKIADFGIAKLVSEPRPVTKLTATGAAIGTPQYMAPEQIEHPEDVDQRADIYSLGVVFYEMLTGELPIGRFAPPSEKSSVDARVDAVVFRTLEKERERRYGSAGEVKTSVEGLATPPPPPSGSSAQAASSPPSVPAPTPPWSWKSVIGAGLAGLSLPLPLLVAIALGAGMGAIGLAEMSLLLGAVVLLGVPGTILGWMGLNDIRAHAGRLRGLPLAVFAALAWPLGLLVGATVVVPMLIAIPDRAGPPPPLWTRFMLLVPAGVITFAIWAVYATARWGANRPLPARRGVLKWIFLGLLLALVGFAVSRSGNSSARGARDVASLRPYPNQVPPQPANTFNGFIEIPAGHLLRLEARLWSNGVAIPASNLTAHILAPQDRPHRDLLAWRILSVGEPGNRGAGWNLTLGGGSNPVLYPPPQGAERPDWRLAEFESVVDIAEGASRRVKLLRGAGLAADGTSASWEATLDMRLVKLPGGGSHNESSVVGPGREAPVSVTVLTDAPDTARASVSRVQGGAASSGARDERAVILTVAAPPREYLILSATVLSNRVPIAQRNLRTKLWPPSSTKTTDFQVKWEPVVTEGASSWDIEVTSPHDGSVQARLCPEHLPQFRWSGVPVTPKSLHAGHEAREFEVARALRRLPGRTEDWSVRLKVQSQPQLPTTSRRGIEADVVLPANQVAVFEVVTRSKGVVTPVAGLAAHVVNGAADPWKGKFIWADDPDDLDGFTALPRWSFGLLSPSGRLLESGLGVTTPPANYTGWLTLWTELAADAERLEGLSNSDPTRPAYGLRVRTQTIRTKPGVIYEGSGFGTNWMKEARSRLAPAEK